MSSSTSDDLGKLVLRLTLGILVLLHGISKLTNGIGGIENMLTSNGWPAFIAWGAYLGEVVGPILLILGFYTRPAALLVLINMVAAIALAHSSQLFTLGKSGGWSLELQGMFLFGALAVILLGAGRYSLGGKGGRYN